MRFLILIIGYLFLIKSQASTIEVIGPCSEFPEFTSEDVFHNKTTTLGDLTVQVFDQNKIPYVGSRSGMNSILNSPSGDQAIEEVNPKELRFYGWCFKVDGKEPSDMPDQVYLKNTQSKIIWFYAYATNLNGAWTEMCAPSYTKKSLQICKK